ncbi:phage tail sheath C-terminal domain-containing protein [Sulfitobacter sp. D35]|uniref:phage tail sheath C-terminal domain-containing protein n=1 Tax=Sulfitobacter sp. D35 TaxID=3083252 RepID=UPI00296F1DC8|nr:phage tail sheath C-terminal domain-containing protein [Sulfitobacter sp. D35]MDW4498759.1 phage tail sheath C-terminal domain-containing protein [Sulfitobacter sp. D35]
MAETFVSANLILPGTYIRVNSEGLIGVRGISAGNIGIVGETDAANAGTTRTLSTASEAEEFFGAAAVDGGGSLNLTAQIGELYRNGARSVFARGVSDATDQTAMTAAFEELIKEDVQLLVAPELDTAAALAVIPPIVESAENNQQDLICVIGADGSDASAIQGQAQTNDRIILAAPGYEVFNPDTPDTPVVLPGNYIAGPVAALISSLAPHISPTNKVVTGVGTLAQRFSYAERVGMVQNRILALEMRNGTRVVRGLTTDDGGFTQVTTRRIVDFAKAGTRQVSNAFIGRLNNERVRAALHSALDGFLTTMLVDEQLTDYRLEVTATRQDEIAGRAVVNMLLQPTFSIDFVAVTITLQ